MFKPRYLLVLFALAAVAGVGYVMRASEAGTAPALLASAERRLAADSPDFDAALRELDRALELALAEGSNDLAREAFLTRARTYVRRGVLGKARTDFEAARAEDGPGSAGVTVEIGTLDLRLGQYGAALSAAAEVLAANPTHSGALTLQGRALYETGRLAMEQAEEIFDAVLPDRDAQRARALAWRAATLDFDHPFRAAAISELGTLPAPDGALDGVRRFLDAATACLTQARGALVAALQGSPSTPAMVQLLILLERGGNWNDSVAFGLAAAAHEGVQTHLDGLASLVAALDALHRAPFAASILSAANEARLRMPPDLMATWCRLLYEAQDWNRLVGVGTATMWGQGRGDPELRATAAFFRGSASLRLERFDEAREDFLEYVGTPPKREPIPGALGWAYYGIARCHAHNGDGNGEHLNLARAVAAEPRLGPEVWVALAEAQLGQMLSPATAADSLMRALNLASAKERPALMNRWEALSLTAMKALGRTVEGAEAAARKNGVPIERNDSKAPTWQFYAQGRRYLAAGDANGAIAAGDAILRRFPEHVLGLDLMLEGRALQQSWRKLTDTLLRRADLYGPHPSTRKLIRDLPAGSFTREQVLRLMELDPQSTGLLRMVAELSAEGRQELAIGALAALPRAQRTPEVSLTLAELYARTGRLLQALVTASEVMPESGDYGAALELAFRVATDTKKPGFLAQIAPKLVADAAAAPLEPAATERAGLWLFAHGEIDGAQALLAALDAPTARDGARLAALGLALVAAQRPRIAEDTLDRAEAFSAGPEPAFARLVLLARTRRWSEMPAEVAALRRLDVKPSPWVDAALLALGERVREAGLAAQAALREPAPEPEWHLVLAATNALLPAEDRAAAPETGFDAETEEFLAAFGDEPRALLVLLCALETRCGAAWAHRELLALAAAGGRAWPPWLMARAYDRLGEPERAAEYARALVRNCPRFRPGWRRLEAELLRHERTRLAPAYAAFLAQRSAAGDVDPGAEPLAAAIVRLLQLSRAGEIQQALELLSRIGPALETSAVGSISAARVLRLAGLPAEAVESFSRALDLVPAAEAAAVVDEFLALGTQAFLERKLSTAAWRAELAALRSQLPASPTASLAWARFERQTAPDGPTGWDLARAEYERFRGATDHAPLDALEPGSAARWAQFFLSESPAEAEEMIRAERLLSPGSPDLWRQLGQALQAQGRVDEAFDLYVAVSNMLPEPTTLRRAAEILAVRGGDHRPLELTLERIAAVERPTAPDASLELLRARSLAHSGTDGVRRAVPLFRTLWRHRERLRTPRERLDLAESYAVAMLQRGDPADGPQVREVIAEILPRVADPLRRDMLTAYSNLSTWMPPRPSGGTQPPGGTKSP
jgi:tetratricopeptide (TPR) repeat protein